MKRLPSSLNWLDTDQLYCLFLDIDGTLSEFQLDPKTSFIPTATLDLLARLDESGIPICFVTGRGVNEAREMIAPLQLPIAGTHGLELNLAAKASLADEQGETLSLPTIDKECVNQLYQALFEQCQASQLSHLYIERKPYSVALHYRQYPHLGDMAHVVMQNVAVAFPEWKLKQGKYVWELVPVAADKGTAISRLCDLLGYQQYCPIFIGDDVTDESGFIMVNQLGGISVKVEAGLSQAQYYLENITAVADWLNDFLQFRRQQLILSNKESLS